MKKYIIVSIIVAALFIGGSIGITRALTATQSKFIAKTPITLTNSFFAKNLADTLIARGASTLPSVTLVGIISDAIKNISDFTGKTITPVIGQQPTGSGSGQVYKNFLFTMYNLQGQVVGCMSCDCNYNADGFVDTGSCTGCFQSGAPASGSCAQS
ncbi:MAG: hypothetical protein WC264_02450 [Candidatus Paceibacterota bacterium]|jgi:hypothetical protein